MSSTPLPLESVAHLSSEHQNYFIHWSKMLRLESEESRNRSRSMSDIWCMDPVDREAQGNCISFLQVFLFSPSRSILYFKTIFHVLVGSTLPCVAKSYLRI